MTQSPIHNPSLVTVVHPRTGKTIRIHKMFVEAGLYWLPSNPRDLRTEDAEVVFGDSSEMFIAQVSKTA